MIIEKCDCCGIIGKKLFNSIVAFKPMKLCGRCFFQEASVLIEKPTEAQIRKADEAYSVYQRLARQAGYKIKTDLKKNSVLPEEIKKALEEEEPKSKKLSLVENFSELLKQKMSERSITAEELAQQLKTHSDIIKEAEKGFLKDEDTAKKLEQFFGIQIIGKEKEKKTPDYIKRLSEIQKNKVNKVSLSQGIEIDFKSKEIKIGDLKKIHEEMQGNQGDN